MVGRYVERCMFLKAKKEQRDRKAFRKGVGKRLGKLVGT